MTSDDPQDPSVYPFSEGSPVVIRERLNGIEKNLMTKFSAMDATHGNFQLQIDKLERDDKEIRQLFNDLRRDMVTQDEMNTFVRTLTKQLETSIHSLHDELGTSLQSIHAEIDTLNRAKANLEGRFWAMGLIFALVQLLSPVVLQYFRGK